VYDPGKDGVDNPRRLNTSHPQVSKTFSAQRG
jgi:hypothetical protein